MFRKAFGLMLAIAFIGALAFSGCSNDDSTPTASNEGTTGDTTAINLVDIADIIENVAPPVYSAPIGAPALDSFEVWTQGEYPLLEKVFGDDDPQTLFRNINDFDMWMGMIHAIVMVDENGNIIQGTRTDTLADTIEGQVMTLYATTTISALSSATIIPTAQQSILGTSYDLDYLINITVPQFPGGEVEIGLKIDSTEQTLLVYQKDMGNQDALHTETSLVYASLDPRDSTFAFKGTIYTHDTHTFSASFIMTSETSSNFAYRMSWYSDEIPGDDSTFLGCIIGGGSKDTEFALKYRQYQPANSETTDTLWSFEEVFGPNYTHGTGLITDYATYVNESLFIGNSDVPQVDVPNPWAD